MARRGKSFTTILKQAAREAERSRKCAERERVQKLNAMKKQYTLRIFCHMGHF